MKPIIYFAGSIRGGRADARIYAHILQQLECFGRVLTEHVGAAELGDGGEPGSARAIHDRDLHWLK